MRSGECAQARNARKKQAAAAAEEAAASGRRKGGKAISKGGGRGPLPQAQEHGSEVADPLQGEPLIFPSTNVNLCMRGAQWTRGRS